MMRTRRSVGCTVDQSKTGPFDCPDELNLKWQLDVFLLFRIELETLFDWPQNDTIADDSFTTLVP
jgi:hypothetical protein